MPGSISLDESPKQGESGKNTNEKIKPSHYYEPRGPPEEPTTAAMGDRWGRNDPLADKGKTRAQKREAEKDPWRPPGPLARTVSSEIRRKAAPSISRTPSEDLGKEGLDRPKEGSDRPEDSPIGTPLPRLFHLSGGYGFDRPTDVGGDQSDNSLDRPKGIGGNRLEGMNRPDLSGGDPLFVNYDQYIGTLEEIGTPVDVKLEGTSGGGPQMSDGSSNKIEGLLSGAIPTMPIKDKVFNLKGGWNMVK